MKPKYRIGTMIEVQRENEAKYQGIIEAVVATKNGFQYSLDADLETLFHEEEVTCAFRPIVARKPRTPKAKNPFRGKRDKLEEAAQ